MTRYTLDQGHLFIEDEKEVRYIPNVTESDVLEWLAPHGYMEIIIDGDDSIRIYREDIEVNEDVIEQYALACYNEWQTYDEEKAESN